MVQCFQSSPAPLPLLARLLQCPLSAAIAEAEVRRLVVVLHAMQTQTQEGAQRAHVEWHWSLEDANNNLRLPVREFSSEHDGTPAHGGVLRRGTVLVGR